jgi:hypothetical protein
MAALKRLHPLMVIGEEAPADRAARLVLETVTVVRGDVPA